MRKLFIKEDEQRVSLTLVDYRESIYAGFSIFFKEVTENTVEQSLEMIKLKCDTALASLRKHKMEGSNGG